MTWTTVTPAPSIAFTPQTATAGIQFWKLANLDDGSGDVNFLYVLDEEAPIALLETQYITLTDTPDVLP